MLEQKKKLADNQYCGSLQANQRWIWDFIKGGGGGILHSSHPLCIHHSYFQSQVGLKSERHLPSLPLPWICLHKKRPIVLGLNLQLETIMLCEAHRRVPPKVAKFNYNCLLCIKN